MRGSCNNNDEWAESAELITKTLRDRAQYDCGLVGKLHLAGPYQFKVSGSKDKGNRIFAPEARPKDDGYRIFHWSHSPFDDWGRQHAYGEWVRGKGVSLTGLQAKGRPIPAEYHHTTFCADKAIDFIKEKRDRPWLMSVNTFDPHSPYDPPPSYLSRFAVASMPDPHFRDSDLTAQAAIDGHSVKAASQLPPNRYRVRELRAAYYAMIEQIDHNVGRLLQTLQETGQRENTLVIFMSDHGDMLGDHGLWRKGCRFYEGLVRVPLILSWPQRIRANVQSNALVELTDLAPTLLELAGLEKLPQMPGRSLLPLLEGRTEPHVHREFVRSEYYGALKSDGKLGRVSSHGTMLRTDRHKLVNYHGHQLGEFFDLERDPWEFDNRWQDSAYTEMRLRLTQMSFDALAHAVNPVFREFHR